MTQPVVGRFAPSPSGWLHLGNLLSLLLAWLDCRSLGGELVFRMEDLDPARSKAEYIDAMADDLKWLGLDWDRGWPQPDYAQSRRTAAYESAFRSLEARGLLYPCWCTRQSRLIPASAPRSGSGCPCADLALEERQRRFTSGRPCAWKIRVPDREVTVIDGHYGAMTQLLSRDPGDFVLRRSDGVYAYQLAVVTDDMAMGITRVVRGRDLLSSSPRQKWLTELLGGTPPDYCHGPLITDGAGKLSKRLGSLSTQVLKKELKPQELTGKLAFLSGLLDREEAVSPRELLPGFSWDRVRKEDIPCPPPEELLRPIPFR